MADSTKSKAELIEERKAGLPLPDDPPAPGDFNSADARTVNVGSGGVSDDLSRGGAAGSSGLREPATADSTVRTDGEAYGVATSGTNVGRGDASSGLPSDAVARGSKDAAGLAKTENPDLSGDSAGSIDATRAATETKLNTKDSQAHGA